MIKLWTQHNNQIYGLKPIGRLKVTDIDEDLVKLANSLFNSEEVVT